MCRLVFLKFFASLLSGYRNFIEVSAAHVFYTQAFLTMRPRSIGQPPEPMLTQFLNSHGFHGLSGKRNGYGYGSIRLANYASLADGLGLPDTDAWYTIETIGEKNNIGYTQFIQLRGFLSHVVQLRIASPHSKDTTVENQQPAEASGVARSWVQSMFSRDTASKSTSFSGVRKWTSDGSSGSTDGLLPFGKMWRELYDA
ncbi:hypothetical protein Prudu_015214 [Prunus dulcis]|uniref:dDENN domain-containing protein n=1 Tax=Prunus dulcis TaxID=3755 RepID=A0A4Y1RIK5_PRUDU|nr:hypothetical protein Prudu_015214 [Prunus dulcis]